MYNHWFPNQKLSVLSTEIPVVPGNHPLCDLLHTIRGFLMRNFQYFILRSLLSVVGIPLLLHLRFLSLGLPKGGKTKYVQLQHISY